ncbi:hypothetical protein KIY80_gp77 [Mycobacterium phage Benvolio]|uniref:Uncharacterized protein n=1 Tax=Mycobacterium phage Benvolio TaxID=2591074 RepID=A0A514A3P6_9CAUD|nr:hypothetical protein CH13_gp080 [Mycobacterium phage Echild]YP_010063514.1 hypothetical protein KIY80_gp77 [Mycobacterium phage Benvolio]AHG24301.1 hypothetical protein PBI_ECHILD_80 [Mycobacterium phage Echild]QDH47893.1 hypothetical protein SEA_BENVOLIO_77 [Mycobacterium phage Benvolio]
MNARHALLDAGIDPDILNWVPEGQTATRRELLESGELTLEEIIAQEAGCPCGDSRCQKEE